MPKTCTITDDIDDLGLLITAAIGLDTSWHKEAACRDYPNGRREDGRTAWHVNINDGDYGPGVSARDIIEVAKMVCYSCPAQWECTRYAAKGQMRAGTWGGLTIGELKWLQKQPFVDRIIDAAAAEQIPIQEHVLSLRVRIVA